MILEDFKKIVIYAKKNNKEVTKIEKFKNNEYRPVYNKNTNTLYWVSYNNDCVVLLDLAVFN